MVHNFYQIGGGEHTVFKNEAALLREHGHKVFEYTRSNDELKESRLKLLMSPFSTIWSFRTYRDIKRIIRKEKIDIVHCHNTFPLISPSVYYAAGSCSIPVIQTIHNFRFLCPNGTFFRDGKVCERCREKGCFTDALKYRCYRESAVQTLVVAAMLRFHRMLGTYRKINYIFLTDFNKGKFRDLIDINGNNVFIKPNFVNVADGERSHPQAGQQRFLFVGRLDKTKGILFLLKSWEQVPENYELRILGEGECEKQVTEAAKNRKNITFLGFQPQKTIIQELKQSTAMLFPSRLYEGYPMTIAESFSVGCPVVSSDIGNQASILRASEGGVLFHSEDGDDFLAALERVIKNRDLYSENAYRYCRANLTPEENYKRMIEIYDCAKRNKRKHQTG